jgi:hypothetical protein
MQVQGHVGAAPRQRQHGDAAVAGAVHVADDAARCRGVAGRRRGLQVGVEADVGQDVFAHFWRVCSEGRS